MEISLKGTNFKEWAEAQTPPFKKWKAEDLIAWCKAHGQVEWLKEAASKMIEHEVYPKIPATNTNGKIVYKVDKTKEPKKVVEKITLIELKKEFRVYFFGEETKTKKEKVDWHDLIASL